jgi:HSP20 family protein
MSLVRIPRDRSRYVAWPNISNAREVDRLFGDFFGGFGQSAPPEVAKAPQGFVPRVAVSESDEAYTVSAELPGVKHEDLEIVIEGKVLTLKGEKKDGRGPEEDGIRRSELSFGSFERRIAFRSPIDEDAVKAHYADGLLTITIPKPEEARPKIRTVPVETA